MDNVKIIGLLFSMEQLKKEDIFEYVCNGKITIVDYKTITNEDCPEIPLDVAKNLKKEEISLACRNIIYGGFTSKAHYNVEKTFGSNTEDQANITGNAQSAISKVAGVAECQADKFYYHASGEPFEEWSASECIDLGRDFKSFKETQLMKSKMIQDYIDTLTTSTAALSITWNSEIPTF